MSKCGMMNERVPKEKEKERDGNDAMMIRDR